VLDRRTRKLQVNRNYAIFTQFVGQREKEERREERREEWVSLSDLQGNIKNSHIICIWSPSK
jgi:hypothetical protein